MSDARDDFFVGYLPTPARLGGFLRSTAIVLLVIAGVAAAIIAVGQRDPGSGRWDLENPTDVTGVIFESPYPILRSNNRSILLVDQGKHGAAARVVGLAGKAANVRGTFIARDGFTLLELAEENDAIRVTDGASQLPPAPSHEELVTLRGEIVDPKCHSGAMKPGEGKTHKACAVLCIRGGIPPVFVDTASMKYLITNQQSSALTGDALEAILPFVGDFVEIHGVIRHQKDQTMLYIQNVQRVKP
jgi:hypothetical protein